MDARLETTLMITRISPRFPPMTLGSRLSRTDQLIQDLTGHIATVVRPPYGSYNDTVAETAARPLILWSVDTLDWETQNADSTVQNVMDNGQCMDRLF